jgi:hypothetical protein
VPIVLKSGSLNLLEPLGPVQACNGIALPLPLPLPYYNFSSHWISSFKCHEFFFSTDTVKPYSVINWFNLCAAFCKLSSVSSTITWSSANSSVDSCWYMVDRDSKFQNTLQMINNHHSTHTFYLTNMNSYSCMCVSIENLSSSQGLKNKCHCFSIIH